MVKPAQRAARKIAFINMKGGVGKTTLAVSLAWELAKTKKVLLVDIDPQFNATQWLISTAAYVTWLKTKKTIYHILSPQIAAASLFKKAPKTKREVSLKDSICTIEHSGIKLDLLPSDLRLIELDAASRGTENRLRQYLDGKPSEKYDYILIDCPPTSSLYTQAAYLAADAYIVPIKPDPLSVLGLPLLERSLAQYEEMHGHKLKQLGLVLSLVRSTGAMQAAIKGLRKAYPGQVFASELPMSTGIAEAVGEGQPLQEFHKTKTALSGELSAICTEFIQKAEQALP